MFKYNIISTFRHLLKRPFFLFINVAGLTLGVLICTIIALYVHHELSVDKALQKEEGTYRLLRTATRNGGDYRIGVTSGPFAEALVNDFPKEIKSTLRVRSNDGLISIDSDTHFNEDKFYLADSNFFEFFHYEFVYGNETTAFSNPQSIVLTDETATRYFGSENPLNRVIMVDQTFEFTVTGVIKKPRFKSQMDFNMISTIDVLKEYQFFQAWWSNGLITYLQLHQHVDPDQFEALFPAFMDKYFGDDFTESGNRIGLTLQPFLNVYFENDVQYDSYTHGNKQTVYLFMLVGIFIVILACINFMNISTAMATLRSKEVGIKKIMGSGRGHLILQYMTESFLICTSAVIVGFMMVEIILPVFNTTYDLTLTIDWYDASIWYYGVLIITSLVLLSGAYPAILLSSFQPLRVLSAKSSGSTSAALWVRKGLVIFQFTCSIILLIATTVIWKQLNYIMDKPLGFDKTHVVLIRNNNRDIQANFSLFTERVEQVPGVQTVTKTVGEPGGFHDTMNFKIEGQEETVRIRTTFSDAEYLNCFGISLASGRFFRKDNALDLANALVLNETAVKILGYTNETILGLRMQNLYVDTTYREVIGVVKDYNFTSLKTTMEPLAISPSTDFYRVAVKIDANQVPEVLSAIKDIYEGLVSLYPFEYRFLDEKIGSLYKAEQTQKQIFVVFSVISILIGCLGIFGLAAFTANQRAKEISIRKVLGASIFNISYMLSNQFVKLVLLANLIAWPLAWYFLTSWLNGFAYRISIGMGSFVFAMMISVSIAMFAVSSQSIKAALVNPAKTLKEN